MRRLGFFLALLAGVLLPSLLAFPREIRLPAEGTLSGNVVIAEWFYRTERVQGTEVTTPRSFPLWPQRGGEKTADWLDGRIEASPGDVILLAPGNYSVQLWVFTPDVTITTDPSSEALATIQGTLEIDADGVTVDRIAVAGPHTVGTSPSGHGIELNQKLLSRVAIRNCQITGNPWTGIHIVGTGGEMAEIRIEDCTITGNGQDGVDAQNVALLVITGCTITGNGATNSGGVGVRLGHGIGQVLLERNAVAGNRKADVCSADGKWGPRCNP
jgi:hypothetical protein